MTEEKRRLLEEEIESFAQRIRNIENIMEITTEGGHLSGEWSSGRDPQHQGQSGSSGKEVHIRDRIHGGHSVSGREDRRHVQASRPNKIIQFWHDNWHVIIPTLCVIWLSSKTGVLIGFAIAKLH